MKQIIVIGGGTAGWITAIFAKKYFSDSVMVISPSSIDILGAGEGSTPNMVGIFNSGKEHHSSLPKINLLSNIILINADKKSHEFRIKNT